ncbi:MAG: TIGR00730 family Rossman fold protein [Alphaproteobacteria bacterium]
MTNNIKSLCVFCGSNSGASPIYSETTKLLAEMFVKNNITLVYGGAALGLMGDVANNVMAKGGKVIGVMPQALIDKEQAHTRLPEIHIVKTMHERKALMADLSDGFILYPGGIGSLDEFFEIWTWSQLSIHNKPYGILNTHNYYDKLIEFLKHVANEKFVHSEHVEKLIIEQDANLLLEKFKNFIPLKVSKWLREERQNLIK